MKQTHAHTHALIDAHTSHPHIKDSAREKVWARQRKCVLDRGK